MPLQCSCVNNPWPQACFIFKALYKLPYCLSPSHRCWKWRWEKGPGRFSWTPCLLCVLRMGAEHLGGACSPDPFLEGASLGLRPMTWPQVECLPYPKEEAVSLTTSCSMLYCLSPSPFLYCQYQPLLTCCHQEPSQGWGWRQALGGSMGPALWVFLGREKPWDTSWGMGESESESSGKNYTCSSQF